MIRTAARGSYARPGLPEWLRICWPMLAALGMILSACDRPAADCALHQVASLQVEEIGGLPIIAVAINGQTVPMIADTGAQRSLLTTAAVEQLQLPPDVGRMSQTLGVGGPSTAWDVRLERLVIGGVRFPVDRMAVGRFTIPPVGSAASTIEPAGLIGADILLAFDMDIDLLAGTMTLYAARRCPDATPPWRQTAIRVRDTMQVDDRLLIPMRIDGHSAIGLLDTGAQRTTIGSAFATRLGLTDDTMAGDPVVAQHGAGPAGAVAHLHRFRSLAIGPAVTPNPELPVMSGDFDIGDALVGQDFLRGRRVWISLATNQVFITPLPGDAALDPVDPEATTELRQPR